MVAGGALVALVAGGALVAEGAIVIEVSGIS